MTFLFLFFFYFYFKKRGRVYRRLVCKEIRNREARGDPVQVPPRCTIRLGRITRMCSSKTIMAPTFPSPMLHTPTLTAARIIHSEARRPITRVVRAFLPPLPYDLLQCPFSLP
jgi:hypothetical protein